jgi:hypothetical protein
MITRRTKSDLALQETGKPVSFLFVHLYLCTFGHLYKCTFRHIALGEIGYPCWSWEMESNRIPRTRLFRLPSPNSFPTPPNLYKCTNVHFSTFPKANGRLNAPSSPNLCRARKSTRSANDSPTTKQNLHLYKCTNVQKDKCTNG